MTTQRELRLALGLTRREWRPVQVAAKDCHLDVRTYCRIMILCASGQGGIAEHIERVAGASADAETIAHGGKPAKRREPGMAF